MVRLTTITLLILTYNNEEDNIGPGCWSGSVGPGDRGDLTAAARMARWDPEPASPGGGGSGAVSIRALRANEFRLGPDQRGDLCGSSAMPTSDHDGFAAGHRGGSLIAISPFMAGYRILFRLTALVWEAPLWHGFFPPEIALVSPRR